MSHGTSAKHEPTLVAGEGLLGVLTHGAAVMNEWIMRLATIALLASACILTLSVVTRYFLKVSTDWQDETSVFLLVGAIDYFRYLKVALSGVLVFIGVKMLVDPHGNPEPRWFQLDIPTGVSLMVVATIIIIAIVLSVMVAEREKRTGKSRPRPRRP